MTRSSASEGGSASIVMLALALVTVVLGLLVADVSVFLGARARAQVAADAAALAAAPVTFRSFGSSAAAAEEAAVYASRNGAQLIECRCPPDASWERRTVEVLVSVPVDLLILGAATVQAWSRAEFVPTQLGSDRN